MTVAATEVLFQILPATTTAYLLLLLQLTLFPRVGQEARRSSGGEVLLPVSTFHPPLLH